jgi:transposase
MHYFASDDGYRMTSVRFNIPITRKMWTAAYHAYGEEALRPRYKGVSIDPDIRIEAVHAVLSGQLSKIRQLPNLKSPVPQQLPDG